MFRFVSTRYRALLSLRDFSSINSNAHLGLVRTTFCIARLLSSSSNAKQSKPKQSLTVSYLVNSCGLSLEFAMSVSKNRKFKLTDTVKADSVLELLRDHGFTKTQISKVVRTHPQVIYLDPERIILPKIEFFLSIGVSRSDLAKLISGNPTMLCLSLKNRLTPNYNFFKNLLVQDEKVILVLKRSRGLFSVDIESILTPKIAFLREIGMPLSQIRLFVVYCPYAATCEHSKFLKIVNEVKEMGFNPTRLSFILAINAIYQTKKSTWDSKIEVYRSWGWSKDDILTAFKRHPYCMTLSEEKITTSMDFLVNKMGWSSSDIAKMPVVLALSLEKRVAPRCSVIQILLSKGLIKEGICPASLLIHREEEFLKRYVTKFQEKVPQLLDVYQGKAHSLDVKTFRDMSTEAS